MCTICARFRPFSDNCDYAGLAVSSTIFREGGISGDAPANTSTPYVMGAGDTFVGSVSPAYDQDWVRITLTAGQAYDIDLRGSISGSGTLRDPYLRLYDSAGRLIAQNDDSGGTLESHLTYTPATTGTYYLSAGAYANWSGSYSLSVDAADPVPDGTLTQLADYLTDGYWHDSGSDPHHFDTATSNRITVNITDLTNAGRQLARWAFEVWESVADIDFVETASASAQITFDDDQAGAYATASWNYLGQTSSAHINVQASWLSTYGTTMGSYAFLVYIHEIGHALGLGHQGDYNSVATYGRDETFGNDSWQLSVMSYFSQGDNTTVNATEAEPVTAMPADIIAMQSLYGAAGAGSLTAGSTIYGVGHTLGSSWLGALFDAVNSGRASSAWDGETVAMTLYDAGGRDIVNFSNDTRAQSVDLRPGGISDVYGAIGNMAIARNTVIEEYRAGSGADTVTGNAAANLLIGNDGADLLYGGLGNDVLRGGAGDDILNGGSLVASRSDGGDAFYGGAGIDTVSYEGSRGSLRVDLVYSAINTFTAAGDSYDSIENLTGSQGADNLRGTTGDNVIRGLSNVDYIFGRRGDDRLEGGIGDDVLFGGVGRDVLLGGTHRDRAQYSESLTAVVLDLMNVARNSGEAAGDSYVSIEDLAGSEYGDDISGDVLANRLFGRGGDDVLTGRGGDDYLNGGGGRDVLLGGAGDDVLRGGASQDTFVFDGGADVVEDFFLDRLRLDDALWGGATWSTAQILARARVVAGDTVFDFGAGNSLTLENVTDIAGLGTAISVF